MRKYLALLFVATLVFGVALAGATSHPAAWGVGVAFGLTVLGCLFARKCDYRASAFGVAFLMLLVWLGR